MINHPISTERGARFAAAAAWLLILGMAAWALIAQYPPRPLPASAPTHLFSAQRAIQHIQILAQRPHPAGSAANDAICAYLLNAFKGLGIPAELQTYNHAWRAGAYGDVSSVKNVVARIPGRASGKAFLIMAHYDSVPYGPGAADDLSGVATMLETARAIKASPKLANDIIFVCSDAEECGLFGARAFLDHPWAKEVGLMLNLEARGTSGPSYMFETSPNNGRIIAEMTRSGADFRANSLMRAVYEATPFSSDFSPLKRRGIRGFNAAFVNQFAYYHTRDDSPEHLSLASLQQHGSYALAFATHFGNRPLENLDAPDVTYFAVLGAHLVYFPLAWATPMMAFAILTLIALIILGLAQRHFRFLSLMKGVLVSLAGVVASLLVTGLMEGAAWWVYGDYMMYNSGLFCIAMATTVLGIAAAFYHRLLRHESALSLVAGTLVWWGVVLAAVTIALPEGAFLALCPMAFAEAGLFAAILLQRSTWRLAALTLAAIPAVLLLVPSIDSFLTFLTVVFAPIVTASLALLAGVLTPAFEYVPPLLRRRIATGLSVAGLALFAIAMATNTASPDRPRHDCLCYALDLDAQRAFWLSSDLATDEWTAPFIPEGTPRASIEEFDPRSSAECLKAPGPLLPLAPPALDLIEDRVDGAWRDMTLRFSSPRRASRIFLRVQDNVEVASASVLGESMGGAKSGWEVRIEPAPQGAAEVHLRVPSATILRIRAIERSFGLPESANVPPRPDHLVPHSNATINRRPRIVTDCTYVARTFEFPPPAPGAPVSAAPPKP